MPPTVLRSIRDTLWKHYRVAVHLAWRDHRQRFVQSPIGSLWSTVAVALTSLILGLVWGTIFGIDVRQHLPFTSSGVVAWGLVSGSLIEAPTHFVAGKGLMLNSATMGHAVVTRHLVAKHVINFLFALPVPVLLSLATGHLTSSVILLPIAILLALTALYPFCSLLGLAGIHFRDLEYFFPSIFTLFFLVTPIFFQPSQLGRFEWATSLNPFYWVVDTIRRPLFGQMLALSHFCALFIIILLGFSVDFLVRKTYDNIKIYL